MRKCDMETSFMQSGRWRQTIRNKVLEIISFIDGEGEHKLAKLA